MVTDEALAGPAVGLLAMMDRVEASEDCRAHGWFVELLADLGKIFEPAPADAIEAWQREQRERAERAAFCVMIPWVVAMARRA